MRSALVLLLVEGRFVGAVGPDADGALLWFSGALELLARLEELTTPAPPRTGCRQPRRG